MAGEFTFSEILWILLLDRHSVQGKLGLEQRGQGRRMETADGVSWERGVEQFLLGMRTADGVSWEGGVEQFWR